MKIDIENARIALEKNKEEAVLAIVSEVRELHELGVDVSVDVDKEGVLVHRNYDRLLGGIWKTNDLEELLALLERLYEMEYEATHKEDTEDA